MAGYNGTFSCGHEGKVYVIGPQKDRQWKIDRKFAGLCPDCYQRYLEEERNRKNQEAAELAREMELPELTGTERQISWANTLRNKVIEDIAAFRRDVLEEKTSSVYDAVEWFKIDDDTAWDFIEAKETVLKYLDKAEEKILSNINASYWIDKRNYDLEDRMSDMNISINPIEEKLEYDVKEIKKDATVSPMEVKHGGIVEITADKELIKIYFEKNEEFRVLVKKLKYCWENGCWQRKINEYTGSYVDRASELGNKLLNAGFSICILDKDIREKAVQGTYEKECDRWIKFDVKRKKLAIKWYDKNDYMYNAARKIPSSTWDVKTKSVLINLSHYEEVEEYAKIYECVLSKRAVESIKEYTENIKDIETVTPNKVEGREHKNGLENILKSSREVIEDLRED